MQDDLIERADALALHQDGSHEAARLIELGEL